MGNEGGRVQSDSKVSEAVQSPTGIYISIVSNCLFKTEIKIFFFYQLM